MIPKLAVSLSAVNSFRHCEQQYSYSYVERLRRLDRAKAPELGTMLHEYLELYYAALKRREKPESAHAQSQAAVTAKYQPELRKYALLAKQAGDEGLAHAFVEMKNVVARMTDRYFDTRGRQDAEEYKVLRVEVFVNINLSKSIVSNGRIDLITQHRDTGRVSVWEHKSTENVPSRSYRLRDLQTPLYVRKAEAMGLCPPVDLITWNYIRTKEPTVPALLKAGGLSRSKSQDTDWSTYLAAIYDNGLEPADYFDMRELFGGRETSQFFPRFEVVILANVDVLYRDYRRTANDIRRRREQWQAGTREPIRNLSRDCDWCEFAMLCDAYLLSGDDSDVRQMRYSVST